MNPLVARWGKRLAARAGLRVRRAGPGNRFEAMDDALRLLAGRGFTPGVIIDGGSNLGQWAKLASSVFPQARVHLIEPQPECQAQLARMFRSPRFSLHPVALSAPGVASVHMCGIGSTGAGVRLPGQDISAVSLVVPATTLDELFADVVTLDEHPLLKLDLEGHEIAALSGATQLLTRVEVVICEVSLYDFFNQGHPLFTDVMRELDAAGFVIDDFAALYPRARDQRLRMADAIFVRHDSPLLADVSWD